MKTREIRIHSPDYQNAVPYEKVAAFLRSLPNVHPDGDVFAFQDQETFQSFPILPGRTEEKKRFSPGPDEAGWIDTIVIGLPYEGLQGTQERLAAFGFNLAQQFGWRVYYGVSRRGGPISHLVHNEAALARRISDNTGAFFAALFDWEILFDLLGCGCEAASCFTLLLLAVLTACAAHLLHH